MYVSMLPGFSDEAHVYAPLGPELRTHLDLVGRYNSRPENPTHWKLRVYAGDDFLARMRSEPPRNMVVLSGRIDRRMEYIEAALAAGQNVLADKPWITDIKDLPRLEAALNMAESKRLIAYDAMTQRFDIAYQIQQALVNDRHLLGVPASVIMESSHYLLKSGTRPVWFLDNAQQGEGMADVGTHLVDLIEWALFPGRAIDYKTDIRIIDARRSPLMLSRDDFQRVTGEKDWPKFAEPLLKDRMFPFYGNSETSFTIRGVQAHCKAVWNFEQKPGFRDTMLAVYTGSIARVQVRQNKEENFLPEVDVTPVDPARKAGVRAALESRLHALGDRYAGLSIADHSGGFRVVIPSALRTPDEQYFVLLTERFVGYMRHPETLPAWEKANMLTKYYITTRAVELARQGEHSR